MPYSLFFVFLAIASSTIGIGIISLVRYQLARRESRYDALLVAVGFAGMAILFILPILFSSMALYIFLS